MGRCLGFVAFLVSRARRVFLPHPESIIIVLEIIISFGPFTFPPLIYSTFKKGKKNLGAEPRVGLEMATVPKKKKICILRYVGGKKIALSKN